MNVNSFDYLKLIHLILIGDRIKNLQSYIGGTDSLRNTEINCIPIITYSQSVTVTKFCTGFSDVIAEKLHSLQLIEFE